MKIGVISDTHIRTKTRKIPKLVLNAFEKVNYIIHAGDILQPWVLEELSQLAPVEAVSGNIDPPEVHRILKRRKIISLGGYKFGLIHGDGRGVGSTPDRAFKAFAEDNVDCIIFGHSHIPYKEERNGILLFNPGSPTDKRTQRLFSYGIIDTTDGLSARIEFFS